MGKKTKSKQRLDSYYHFAKQQGYRSRAAYKLIQLNRKYSFLNTASVLIDLCAAPGGWMQVAAEFMPLNSTVVGVDLDPIKKVQGTTSFIGDITTNTCYDQLRREIKGRKCDVVLNDGAPNVGANWSKDAYSQSQLVLAALKLACSFLKEGGYFVTKVFRSTDFQSLMWVFKKFFGKVEATKPKASRFSSAEIFVVCGDYLAPSFIDEKLFDAKFIFKDTQADHFKEQLAGQITSIDKLLQNRRRRGGYEDNAPMHLYKETTLTNLINSENALLVFAEYNRIIVSPEEKTTYYGIIRTQPPDLDLMFEDLKVLGKREVGNILKWRGKIRHHFFIESEVKAKSERKEGEPQSQQEDQNSSEQLEHEVLTHKKQEIRKLKEKEGKRSELIVRSEIANKQHEHDDAELEEQMADAFDSDIEELSFQNQSESDNQKKKKKGKQYADFNAKQMEKHLEEMYQQKIHRTEQKRQAVREKREQRKDRREERSNNLAQKLKSRRFAREPYKNEEEEESENEITDLKEVKFKNPLAGMDEDDIYISENEESYDENAKVDPDEKMEGEVSDDDAYVIPKPMSDMEKRRKQLKKNENKKEKKLKKDIEEGGDVGGQIQIVKNKTMENYNIDELAETLAIAKKMLRNRPRQQLIDNSYSRYTFQDHDDLPKWFTQDQKRHNFKKVPITKEEFKQEKDRLMAINARVPKKILEAKVRRKLRVQKKLKKTQKVAENVMSQEGITEVNKLRQVSKLYDKSKKELKDKKKYLVSKRGRSTSGKDSRNVVHVDKRLKKDKRSMKIKKTRQVHRKHKSRGKF